MEYINNYFDKIIFIHCVHRTDRMDNIKLLLEKTKITNYIILEATYLPQNGAKGCSHSHYKAMDLAFKNEWDKVLIIEDDFQFNDKINFKEIIDSIKDEWDVLMPYWHLNCKQKRTKRITKNLRKLNNKKHVVVSTVCYAVNKNMISILRDTFLESFNKLSDIFIDKEQYELRLSCDTIWHKLQLKYNWYLIDPKLGYCMMSKSDVVKNAIR